MKFEVQIVNSTAIRLVAYSDNTLRILFRSGSAYDYSGVNKEIFENLCNADSVGTEFQKIRNTYQFKKLNPTKAQDFLLSVIANNQQQRLVIEEV